MSTWLAVWFPSDLTFSVRSSLITFFKYWQLPYSLLYFCSLFFYIVSWSFTLTCLFWSFGGNVPSFQTCIRQGSRCTDSSTDGRGTCGRKIRLKCAGCNQCERMSEVKGKVKQLSWELRGERQWWGDGIHLGSDSGKPHSLSHRKVKPGKDQNKLLLLVGIIGFCSPLGRASWSAISNIADGFRNINSAKNSGLARTWKFI